jgi:hypothetical protein
VALLAVVNILRLPISKGCLTQNNKFTTQDVTAHQQTRCAMGKRKCTSVTKTSQEINAQIHYNISEQKFSTANPWTND